MSDKVRFTPVRGKEEKLLARQYEDGNVYFAYDTKKIYLDANGQSKIPMGASSSGIYYGTKVTTEEEDATSVITFKITDIDGEKMPNPNDLVLNDPDKCFYRVKEVDTVQLTFTAQRLAVAGAGGGGVDSEADAITVNITPLERDTYIFGEKSYITITPRSKLNKQGVNVDTYLNVNWTIQTSDGKQSISGMLENVKHDVPIEFEFGSKLFANQFNYISFTASGLNSGSMKGPVSTAISCVKMSLKEHNEFSALTLFNTDLNMVCQVEGQVEKILEWYFDGNLVRKDILTKDVEGRQSCPVKNVTHGAHTVEIRLYQSLSGDYGTAVAPLTFEIACKDGYSTLPIIWTGNYKDVYFNYEKIQVPYMVYNPKADSTVVKFYNNGTKIAEKTVTYSTENTKNFEIFEIVDAIETVDEENPIMNYYTITAGEAPPKEISFQVVIDKSRPMKLAADENLLLKFSSAGRSNNESNITKTTWSYQKSENDPKFVGQFEDFNWYNNGWITDQNGDTCLRISNGAKFHIPVGMMFGSKKKPGVTFNSNEQGNQSQVFEFEFKIRNIQNYEHLIKLVTRYKNDSAYYEEYDKNQRKNYDSYDQFLQAYLPTVGKNYDSLEYDKVVSVISIDTALCNFYDESSKVGFCLGTQDAFFTTGENTLTVNYVEDRMINLSLVFSKNEKLVSIYLNGVLSGAAKVTIEDPFTIGKEFMVFNSDYCDVDLYKFRMYNTGFSISEVLNNYAVDTRNVLMYDQSTKLSKWDASIEEFVLDYDSMITFNDDNPDDYLMPYLLFSDVPGDALPYSKKDEKTTDVSFVNTGLDRAWSLGEIEEMAKEYHTGEIFQGYFATADIEPYFPETKLNVGPYYATVDGEKVYFTNPENTLRTVSRKFKNKDGKLIPVHRVLTKAENYYIHHGASFSAKKVEFSTQGTSSQFYPRRNYKIKCKELMYADRGPFKNDVIHMPFFFMDNDSVGTTKFTLKIDYMESSGSYNTGFANLVANAYTKHPLNDYEDALDKEIDLNGFRTSVQGFPTMAFHAKTDKTLYIGRYNMNIDKGSDEMYGYKLYENNDTFFGSKVKNIYLIDDEGKPMSVNDTAECWEFSDNNRGYCSFRDPLNRKELSFVITKDDIERAGQIPSDAEKKAGYRLTAKGTCPIVADSFEYRYHADGDMLDYLYDPSEFDDKDKSELLEDYKLSAATVDDLTWRKDFLKEKMSNWEKAVAWVWSTCTENVKPEENIYDVYAVANSLTYDRAVQKYDKETGSKLEALLFNPVTIIMDKDTVENDLKQIFGYDDTDLLTKWGQTVSITNDNGETTPVKQLTTESYFLAYADNYGYEYVSYELVDGVPKATFNGGTVKLRSAVNNEINNNLDFYKPKLLEYEIDTLTEPYVVGNITYYFDTQEYRLAKFKNEFDKHFDKEYAFKYFMMTEVFMTYDSRGKNAMFASWGPHEEGGDYIWYPVFYDIDTQLGINNTGIPSFEYYVDATEDGCYSTNDSVLWGNIFRCFLDELKATYQALRTSIINQNDPNKRNRAPIAANIEYFGQSPVEWIENWYTCKPATCDNSMCMRGHRPLIAINFDEYYKYISIMNTKGPGYQGTEGKPKWDTDGSFLYALQGDRGLSRQQFLTRRINFVDSWLTQGNYVEGTGTTIKFRTSANDPANTSDIWVDNASNKNSLGNVVPGLQTNAGYYDTDESGKIKYDLFGDPIKLHDLDANFFVKLTPFQRSYVTLATDNAPLPSLPYEGSPVRFEFPANVKTGIQKSPEYAEQLLYLYGADYLKDIGDVSLLYPREFELKGASHLQRIILGNDHPSYFNKKLKSPQFDAGVSATGGKPLLKEVVFTNVQTDDSVNVTLDFQSSEKLQIFRALGMNLAGVKFANGVALHTLHLPASITQLSLKEARNLTNVITEYEVPQKDAAGNWQAQEGLYIKNLTDLDVGDPDFDSDIASFEIIGNSLNYQSYDLLKKLFAIKENNGSNLAISLENVNWSPFSQLEKGYPYKASESHSYYVDNEHYQLIPLSEWKDTNGTRFVYSEQLWNELVNNGMIHKYNLYDLLDEDYEYQENELNVYYIVNSDYNLEALSTYGNGFEYNEVSWKNLLKDGLIYKKNLALQAHMNTIQDIEMFKTLATKTQYKSTAQTNNEIPNITGNIYVNNSTAIDESWIKNTFLTEYYPDLKIFVNQVNKAYSAKFVKINDNDGSMEVVGTQKVSPAEAVTKTYFDSPYELYSDLTHKDNYDFYGWSTVKDDEDNVITSENWSTQTYVENKFEYTYYIVYKPHPYKYYFLNSNDVNVLQGNDNYYHEDGYYTTVPYGRPDLTEAVPSVMPCSPEEKDLADMFTCLKFIGWTDTKNSTIPYDFKRAKSIRDMTFYPIYEEKNVYDDECVLGKTYFHIETNENDQNVLVLNPGVKLAGKITLPTELDGKRVHLLNTYIFLEQNDITHIFWKKGSSSLTEISASAFENCANLIYFEMPNSVKVINAAAFQGCTNLLKNSEQTYRDKMFENVEFINGNAFTDSGITGLIRFGGSVKEIRSYAFTQCHGISGIEFGSINESAQVIISNNAFFGCYPDKVTYYINSSDKSKWEGYEQQNKFGFQHPENDQYAPQYQPVIVGGTV